MIEIYDNRNNGGRFSWVEVGEVFECEGLYCIKINESVCNGAKFNAVDLQTGEVRYFNDYQNVTECKNVQLEIDD